MKKSISIIVFICMLTLIVLPISASNNSYSDNEATIITQESFEQLFNVSNIDEVSYEYQFEILQENSTKANVMLQSELIINNQIYNIQTTGTVDSYLLNDNDTLWEGPLDGSVYINDEEYSVIAGFALLSSTQETMVSLTIENDSTMVAISFGTNIIDGSVLDLFLDQTENSNTNDTNVSNDFLNSETNFINPDDSCSINAFGPGFSVICHPGEGTALPHLGPNDEWKYQSVISKRYANTMYYSIKSGVYFDDTRNILMVTLTPYSNDTLLYANTLGYDAVTGFLKEFEVNLTLEDVSATNYAYISQIHKPQAAMDINNYFDMALVSLLPLFEDILGILEIPSSTISTAFEHVLGRIDADDSELFAYVNIKNSLFSNYSSLDAIASGLPFRFVLSKGNSSVYTGNTPYTVNTFVKYRILTMDSPLLSGPQFSTFYIERRTTHTGTVTLK